jgi:hypothetical protein
MTKETKWGLIHSNRLDSALWSDHALPPPSECQCLAGSFPSCLDIWTVDIIITKELINYYFQYMQAVIRWKRANSYLDMLDLHPTVCAIVIC